MMDDIYLNLAIELFEKGTWTKDAFIKRVTLYANEKGMDMNSINDMIDRVCKPKEVSIEDKRDFLSKITIVGDEPKYGEAAMLMDESDVNKFYEMEQGSLEKESSSVTNNSKEEQTVVDLSKVVDEEVKDKQEVKPNKIVINRKDIKVVKSPVKEEERIILEEPKEVIVENNTELQNNSIIEEKEQSGVDLSSVFEESEPTIVEEKVLNDLTVEDIVNCRYTYGDLFGNSSADFNNNLSELVRNVKESDFERVLKALEGSVGFGYARRFSNDWNEFHKKGSIFKEPVVEEVLEEKTASKEEEIIKDDSRFVIPPISLEGFDEDLPKSEEEFTREAEKMNKPEKDSKVKVVDVSKERLARLKINKQRAINSFLKTGVLVLAYSFMNPYLAVGATLGYMYFADAIRSGDFKANNPVTKALKWSVEKVMYLGKDKEEERGKTR